MRKNALTRAMGIMTAAAALLCAAGCEIIGLGAAVDAAPPAIYISTPTVNQAVSSTFDITGTCTDDTGVREIRIQELRHNDDPNISYKDLGKISPNSDGGTWGITLEHNGDFSYTFNGRQMDLPDGTYIIETTANDGSRDSSNPAARAFDIDNTPPIFLVSSPNSIEGSVGKSYGREIAITGTIADGHDITKMRVKAYDNDGNEISLAKSEFNVPDKALVSVILAKYDAVTEEAYESLDPDAKILQQNYMRLFGRTENVFTEPISTVGYANVSIAIELEDKAGNKSERTFLSDGLTSLARANAGLDESTIIDSATYMYILNGNNTVSVPLSDAGKAVVRNALLGIGDNDTYKFMSYDGETNHKRLIMKINPDNSPTYKVSGYAIDAENTKWKDLPNEAQITLEIKSGRDGYTFKPSDLKVCIYEEDGNGGLTKDPSFLKWFYDKDNRYDKFMESGDSIRGLASTTQGTYQIILPGSDESPFVQNKKYYLVVEGKDANDNAMVPENGAYYGFKIMESGKAPWLECEDAGKYRKLENVLSSGNTDSKLTVTIYDQEKKITSYNGPDIITYDVEWFEGHYESVSELAERTPVLRQLGNQIGKNGIASVSQTQYSVQIPLGSPASTSATNYTIKVSVTANNGAASSNKTSYLVYADGKAPVVTLENPELESSGSKKINSDTSGHIVETDPATGNVSHFYELRGKVKDVDGSGVYRIYVSYNGSRYEVTDTPQVTAETGWRYKLPVVEGTGQTIRIEAVDKNENNVLGDPVTGITMDFKPPVVGLVSIKEGDGTPNPITNVADIEEYYNQKPITVRIGITDSIGVAENGISILTYRDDTRINENFYVETSVATDRSYEDIKLKIDGKWKVVVQATDMAGAKSKEFTFELMIDTTKPVINNDAAVEGLTSGYTSSDVVRISGTATEQGSGLSKVEYKLTDSNGTTSPDWIPSAATGTGANATFNLSVSGLTTAKGGHNTIQVRLVDKAGNPSEPKTFEVNVDNAAPVITSEYYKSGSGAREEIPSVIYYKGGDASKRTFYGTISDEGGISGVQLYADGTAVSSGVTYTYYTTASPIAYDTNSSWVALPANGIVTGWKAELDAPVAGNITVKATDKAGHVSSAQVTKFISDATAPVLTVTNLSDNGSIRETDRNADGSYTLRGTWSDAGSGTKELQWSVDGENFTTVSESDAPKTTGTANWAVNIPGTSLSETESFAITLKASDNAGNMTERQITGISYDLGAPNIRINKINGTSVSTLEKYYKRDANALSIEILADDSLGVDDIEIVSIKRNDSAAASTDYNFSTAADGVNKKGIITIARDGSGDGAWEIKLRAKDKVGRYSQELLISTTVDGTNPSVNIGAATAEGTLVGNDSDTWFKNTTIRVGASASDEGSSKLKEIYYQVVSSSIGSVPEDITGESNAETASVSGSSASFNVTVSDLPGTNASGTNWVLLQAVDNAGNKSGVEKVIINVDTEDPALSALFADEDSDGAGLVEIPGTKYFNSDTQDFTIYGAVSDAGGLASLVFAVDGTPVTPESLKYSTVAPSSAAAITGNISSYTEYSSENKYAIKAWSAKFKLSEFVSGGKLSATATDVSGRKTILTNIIQFTNDSTPPVLVIRTPSDDALITENSLTGDNFVVSGTWSDAGGSGAKQMEWSLDGNSYRNDYVNAPETTASATWQISIPKTELTAGSGKTIYVKAADAAGNWSNPSSVTGITCDYELPELVLESPSSLGSTYARSGSTLDLTFAATDDRGISAIVVDSIKVDDAVVNLSEHPIPPYTITPVDSDGKSVLSIRRDGTLDGKWVIKVRATDSSGRDSEPVTVSTIIDATAPTVTMDSSDAWYNNNIVRLNASASDTGGSGLATVYFAVVPSTDSTHRDDIRSEAGVDHVSIAGNSSEFSITVRNLAESTADLTNKILLQAVDGAGNLGTVTAVSGFKVDQTVPNIESKFYTYDGSSTNAHYEAASGTVLSSKSGTLTIYGNIDDKNASLGTNGAVQSGIKNLSFSLVPSGGGNARNLSATVTYSTTEIDTEDDIAPDSFVGYSQIGAEAIRSYKAVINAANLDSGNMRAVLTDMAENVTSQTIFTVENDEVKPEINLRTPATVVTWSNSVSQNPTGTPAKVNGKITVSGSASDNSALSIVKLYWRTNGIGGVDMNSGWNYVTEFNGTNAYNWSREFEMTRTDSETGNIHFLDGSPFSGSAKEVEIKVEAEDKASNKANRVFKYVMDPESDRPEIKFNNISLKVGENQNGDAILLSDSTRTWLLSKTIYGVVTDDDGVKEFGYRIGGSGDFTPVTNIQNGSWTINLTGEDGEKDIYFRVVDSEDTEFVSRPFDMGSFSYCSSPVLSDTAGHTLGTYSVLGLKVDTSAPNVGDIKYKILTTDDHAEWSGESTDFTNGKFGGKYKWLKILMTASDPSGIDIDSIEYELNGTAVGVGEHEGNVYCSERIDLSGLATGVYTLKTMVKDGAGAITEKSVTFNVDNTPPVITIEPQGLIKAAVSMYGTVSELGSATYFAVTLPDDTAPDKNVFVGENEAAARKWMEIDGVSLSYNVTFDGNLTTTGATHTDMFRKYIPMLYESVTQDMIDDGSYETVTTLRFHVMSVDRCGNTNFKYYDVSIDPQGTRPEADISYPSKSSTPTLGGTVTLMGIATDTVGVHPGVKDVGVMIDVNEDGRWNYGDISILHTKASYLTFKKYDTDTKQLESIDFGGIDGSKNDDYYKYISVATDFSGAAWSLEINADKEFDPADEEDPKVLTVWVFAVDKDGDLSPIDIDPDSDKMNHASFKIDGDAPAWANARFINTDDNNIIKPFDNTGTVSLKGTWYFEMDVFDNNGIESVTVDNVGYVVNKASVKDGENDFATALGDGKGFKIRFKVGDTGDSDGVFKETHTIRFKEIKDKDPLSGEINLDLQFDNMAPVIATDEDTGYNIIKYEAPEKNRVVNYNGFYTFGSWAKEEPVHGVNQTGVSRVAVYFTRNVGNDAHDGIFDPMIAKDATGNRSPVTDLAYEDNLYWRTVGISTGQAANHTLVLAGSDPNIHAGGLIKVNGIIYRIDRVDGSTLTLDTSFVGHGTAGTAKIAIANVVDNPLQEGDGTGEKNAAGYWTNPALDDGDCMIESFIKQGSKCTWDANINTRNIGDGTAYLHYVVFDEAGNSSHESVPIYIGNNLPRVAGLKFATDNSTNGDYEGDEICDDYSGLYAGGKDGRNDVTKIVFPSESTDAAPVAIATVKNKMLLQPEIVGGNGNLKYVASIAERNGSTGWNAPYKTLDEFVLKNDLGSQLVGSTDDTAKVGKIEFTVPYMITNEFRDGDNQKLKLLVKDSTPGESMEAEVSVILNLALRDSNPPVIKIRPFYWNSSAENSLFGNSTENGHIELPSDLPESFVSDGSGVDDRQPKVSGKIKIEGIAQDDAQLRVIKLDVFGTEKTVGTYNGAWEIGEELTSGGEIPASGYAFTVEQAKYADLIREGIITAVPEGKEEDDKVNYFSAEYGHVVKWTAYIDTAKVMTDAAETDREIKAYAVDRGTPNATGSDYENPNHSEDNDVSAFKEDGDNEGAQSGGTNGSGVHTDFYAVDVVPYITDVTTALSLTKKNNPSVYSRSALGHYPVAATETVKMTGFNLAGGTVKFNAETGTADVAYNASGFAIPSGAKSGNVSISVNGVGSLNNKNGNDSHGSYAKTVDLSANPTGDKTIYDNYYNRQPNGDNNNLLTDDVVLDIWQFKDAGISQTSGYITEPIMKVNPKNGMLNFGFNSGPANYCMANGENTSYTTWVGNYARFSTCGFTVDENGVTHGITVGLDTNPGDSGSAGRLQYFTSKWGRSQLDSNGNYEGKNSSRIDNIGAPAGTYNGVSFDGYVFIEDRFASPSLTTAVHGSDTYVYLAYYDDLNGQIRFKYGNLSKTTVGTSDTITTNPSGQKGISFEQFADQRRYKLANGSDINDNTHTAFDSNSKPEYYSVIAGSSQTAKAGNYLSIDVIKGSTAADDVVVATWYDATAGKWYYSYKVNPCNDNDMAASPSNTPTSGNWRKPIELKANAGESCQITVDKVGGIHIASYDTENANLLYAYLSSYDDATPQVVTVDAYAFTGTNIRLDTAVSDDGGHIVPYIGYYMSSTQKPKMAYLPDVISASGIKADREAVTILHGADDSEAVTGTWESSLIPSSSRYADNYSYSYVNIGLWKDASTGKAKIMTGTDVAYTNKSGLKQENTSKVYGNGTANPVMAYATRVGTRGHIETAQMK